MTYTKEYKQYLELKKKKRDLKVALNEKESQLAKLYRLENPSIIKTIDWIIIIAIVFNMGAMLLTNIMVTKDFEDIKFVEANPVQCKLSGFWCMGKAIDGFVLIFKQLIIYGTMVYAYSMFRNKIKNDLEAGTLRASLLFLVVSVSFDFINNFGYWLGVLIFH